MTDDLLRIDFDTMERFMAEVFMGQGVPEEDARICADVLITADKRGIDSHGINRMKPFYYDRIVNGMQNAVTEFEIVRESPTTAVVDGHHGMGHVIGKRSMQMAIDKAKEFGMGMVAVRNSTHYGIAGYYSLMAAKENMIGITGTNARPAVVPTFGVEGMFGTNPLTIGMPTDEEFPFCIDCATSQTQRGKIEVCARKGEDIPAGGIIGEHGEIRTDSELILIDLVKGKAAFVPLGGVGEETGGYKGYGYATAVEIMCAALQGGAFLKAVTGVNLGHFFIAIDISTFSDPDDFRKTAGDILRSLRSARKMPGADRIYTAGEKEHLAWLERKDTGIAINDSLRSDMIIMRDELGLTGYDFL